MIFMYCSETSTICVTYLDVAWEPRFQSPRRHLSSFYCVFTTPVLIFIVSSLLPACMWSIADTTDTFCQAYSDVAWDGGDQSPRRISHWEVLYFGIIHVQIGFYSIFSLHLACEVSTVFIVVETTLRSPENKYPESQDAQINKELCPCC